MIQIPMIIAIASAECRSVRRLTRYWVFSVLAVLIAVAAYAQLAVMHGMFSHLSATIGALGPRYMIASSGMNLLMMFLVGLIFLAFDVRARDEREKMAEVLDSRPVSNVEFLLGRCLGLVFMSLLPALFVLMAIQSFGFLALLNDWAVGEPVEPYSIVSFVLHAVTALTVWCVLIVFISVLVRNRLVIALAALGLLGLQFWVFLQLPLYLQRIFTVLLPNFDVASDILPVIVSYGDWGNQLSLWALAAGLFALAAALHPRSDGGSMAKRASVGCGLLATSVIILLGQFWYVSSGRESAAVWLATHEESSSQARADLLAITGSVRIDPGTRLDIDLEMRIRLASQRDTEELLFTFNPGLMVKNIKVGDAEVQWTHTDGLLRIGLANTPVPGNDVRVSLQAAGRPDTGFGYLDNSVDMLGDTAMNAQIAMLGFDIGIFTDAYVALMPGNRWLPRIGSDVPSADPRTHPDDFFDIDLEVEAPVDWLVVAPGRRQVMESNGRSARFQFQPNAPVAEVGLFASRFERRSLEVADVELEILVYPDHDRNLEFFVDAATVLQERLEEMFAEAERLGIPYPYGTLSLVEVPNRLRGYTGGWRMDTALTMPGILLVKENSFPTARFQAGLKEADEYGDEDEGGIEGAKVAALERFFENDFTGGNLFTGASRNFLKFQTSARGEGALGVNFVLDELVSQLLTDRRGYFSAHEFTQQANLLVGQTIVDMATGRTDSIADAVLSATSRRPSVWDRALSSSLADLEPTDDPGQSLNVLVLKSRAIAKSILDGFGRKRTAELLSGLLDRFRGRSFGVNELDQIALGLNMDLNQLLGDWLHESALPGFLTSNVVIERLPDDDMGNPQYQTRVHIRNDEPVPGLLRLNYSTGGDDPTEHGTDPYRFGPNESQEIGILSTTPIDELYLAPYLSLNRRDTKLRIPEIDNEERADREPFLGSRASTWQPSRTDDIIVDDLDEGFSVQSNSPMDGRIPSAPGQDIRVDMDQGLPAYHVMIGLPQVWSRSEEPQCWGKYRKTQAMIRGGDGTDLARFAANIPSPGLWRLAYHIGSKTGQKQAAQEKIEGAIGMTNPKGMAKYHLSLVSGEDQQTIDFDAAAAEPGWNDLGEFRLPAGEAVLEVSNETSGVIVIADAVRWRPVSQSK